jgi:hypothetical protein
MVCPMGFSGSMRSATIFKIARRGTARTAPGIPQIVCQKNNETITSTGFKVKRGQQHGSDRLALGDVDQEVSCSDRCIVLGGVIVSFDWPWYAFVPAGILLSGHAFRVVVLAALMFAIRSWPALLP